MSGHDEQFSAGSHEIEAKLVITSKQPEDIIDTLLSISRLGSLYLEPRPDREIRDRYFDTEAHALAKQDCSLRIRNTGGQVLVAYKGKSHASEYGGIVRREVEEAWSREGLLKVLAEIPGLQHDEISFEGSDPVRTLANLGLQVIQDRETRRHVRNVCSGDELLAEMAIDRVQYTIDSLLLIHHEIEIEAKSAEGARMIAVMIEQVQEFFPGKLRGWSHSKLATGEGLKELVRKYDCEDLVLNHNIRPDVYAELDSLLENRAFNRSDDS